MTTPLRLSRFDLRDYRNNPARFGCILSGQVIRDPPSDDQLFDQALALFVVGALDVFRDRFTVVDAPNRRVKAWLDAKASATKPCVLRSDVELLTAMARSLQADAFVDGLLSIPQSVQIDDRTRVLGGHTFYDFVPLATSSEAMIFRTVDKIENAVRSLKLGGWAETASFAAAVAGSAIASIAVVEERFPHATIVFSTEEDGPLKAIDACLELSRACECGVFPSYLHMGRIRVTTDFHRYDELRSDCQE